MNRRVLLLVSKQSYRLEDFKLAAGAIGAEIIVGTDRCHVLSEQGAIEDRGETLVLGFSELAASTEKVVVYFSRRPFAAVVAVDEPATELAAQICGALGLVHNDLSGVKTTRDKLLLRRALTDAGLPQARFVDIPLGVPEQELIRTVREKVGFPCVLKPRSLSMSRGVMRAEDEATLSSAFRRVSAILRDPEVRGTQKERAETVLVESFLPGLEISIEGLLERGVLRPLAVFDKPDPMDGPTFEETIYVTPSRHDPGLVRGALDQVQRAAQVLGLVDGPVHAEVRLSARPTLIEIAPRSIGGLCSRTLEFGTGRSLETLILEHALGLDITRPAEAAGASGVLMVPIPGTGTLVGIHGLEEARQLPCITQVVMTKGAGDEIVALPEGHAYAGFAFARAETPSEVESALRRLRAALRLEIRPRLPVFLPQTVDGVGSGV